MDAHVRHLIEISRGIPSRQIEKELKEQGYDVSRRQIIKTLQGATPEKLAAQRQGLRPEVASVRDSWRKNAAKHGLNTNIRGNTDYKEFKKQIDKQNAILAQIETGMKMTIDERKKFVTERLRIYLRFGLIDDEQYEEYLSDL